MARSRSTPASFLGSMAVPSNPMMIDVTDATFETDVLQRSMDTPVVVDLWAPWCGPCKTLGPIIEKVVDETEGRVVLAKINVDENPGASQAFRVQSIPAVYAIDKGQVVDGFMGAQGEDAIREFVATLLPSPDDLAIAELMAAGDEASLLQALEASPGNVDVITMLAALYVETSRFDEALAMLEKIPETELTRPLAAQARLGIEAAASEHAETEARLDALLPLVKADDEARQEFVDLLEVLGSDHPNTGLWRRKLSTQLY